MYNRPIAKTLPAIFPLLVLAIALIGPVGAAAAQDQKPNILFISVDDLNDWIGCRGGNAQSVTPNFDRLAASGVLFTNAHCAGAACNPSSSAIFTGRAPNASGMYSNGQSMRQIMPDRVLLPQYFRDHGQAPPASVSDGNPFTVFFINQTENEVALHWVDLEGNLKAFGTIEPGTQRPMNSRPGAVWQVSTMQGRPIGHFVVGDRSARAVVPE